MFGTFLLPFSVKGIFRRLFNILKQQISLPFRILQVQKSQPFRAEPYSRIADVASLSRESPEEKKNWERLWRAKRPRGKQSPLGLNEQRKTHASKLWLVCFTSDSGRGRDPSFFNQSQSVVKKNQNKRK